MLSHRAGLIKIERNKSKNNAFYDLNDINTEINNNEIFEKKY